MAFAVQILVDALSVGGLYALTALGIGLIFSVMRLGNFAHAEFVTVGGYALLLLSGWPFPIAFVVMLAAIVALAVLTERFAFRPLRSADAATLLISSFAVSMFLQKLLIFAVGSRPKALDPLPALSTPLWIGGVQLSSLKLVIILVCALALGGLTLFLRKTRYGLQMRAAAEDFTMSRLVGVRANLVIALAFALSGGLAAIVAPLFVAEAGFVQPRFGVQIVIVAFVATVIGGLGSLEGAVVGAFLVGAASTLLQTFLPPDLRPFREAFVFLAVILVLLVRPQGLLPARGLKERV